VHLDGRETWNVDNKMKQIYMIKVGSIIRTKYRNGSYEGTNHAARSAERSRIIQSQERAGLAMIACDAQTPTFAQ
jgi:hypothetical protein